MGLKVQCFRVSYGPNGKGMYQGPDTVAASRMFELSGRHPGPNDDAAIKDAWSKGSYNGLHREYFFGFKSLDQLRQWIYKTEWRQELHDTGYEIHIWEAKACVNTNYMGDTDRFKGTEVRPYLQGDTQMVFMPWYFTHTDTISLLTV